MLTPLCNQLCNTRHRSLHDEHKSLSLTLSLLAGKFTYRLRLSTFRKSSSKLQIACRDFPDPSVLLVTATARACILLHVFLWAHLKNTLSTKISHAWRSVKMKSSKWCWMCPDRCSWEDRLGFILNTFHISQYLCWWQRGAKSKRFQGGEHITDLTLLCRENNTYNFPCHSAIGRVQVLLNLQVLSKEVCYGSAAPLVPSSAAGLYI